MQITQRPSPNRNIGRQNQVPDFIVCHITGGSFTSALNTILNAANQVSYHFVVGRDGAIIQAVNIEDTAWANGTTNSGDNRDNRHSTIPAVRERRRNANQFTVSIGFADSSGGELSAAQLSAGVDLIVHIKNEVSRIYGFHIPISRSNIIGHHEINPLTRANCPGPRFPWDEIIRKLSMRKGGGDNMPRYNTIGEVPSGFARDAVQRWVADGHLRGSGVDPSTGEVRGLDLTMDMIRGMILGERITEARISKLEDVVASLGVKV